MVYKIDNRIRKHRTRNNIIALVVGIMVGIVFLHIYENYREPIMNNVNQIKDTAIAKIQDEANPNPVQVLHNPQSKPIR